MFGTYTLPTGIVEGIPHIRVYWKRLGSSLCSRKLLYTFYPIIMSSFLRAIWRIPFLRQSGSRVIQTLPILQNLVEKKKHHDKCLESFLAHLPALTALGCNLAHSWEQGDFEPCFRKQIKKALLFLQQEFTEQKLFHFKKKKYFPTEPIKRKCLSRPNNKLHWNILWWVWFCNE